MWKATHHTEFSFEQEFWYQSTPRTVASVTGALLDDFANVDVLPSCFWQVPFPLGVSGEGFLTTLVTMPEWSARVPAAQPVLFSGPLPEALSLNGRYYPVKTASDFPPTKVEQLCGALVPLMSQLRSFAFVHPERVARLVDLVERLLTRLMAALDEAEVVMELAPSVVRTTRHHLQRLMSDIVAFSKVTFHGEAWKRLQQMKFAKALLRRVKHTFTMEDVLPLVPRGKRHLLREAPDAVAFDNTTGRLIRVVRSGASDVEPWLLRVEHVASSRSMTVGAVFCAADGTLQHGRNRVTDLLPDEAESSPLLRMYLGYVFTRVPYLHVSSQLRALVTVAWVRATEQAFRLVIEQPEGRAPSAGEVTQQVETAVTLFHRVQALMARDPDMVALLPRVIKEDAVEPLMTTTNNVSSMCRFLGMLALPAAGGLVPPLDPGHGGAGVPDSPDASDDDSDGNDAAAGSGPGADPGTPAAPTPKWSRICFAMLAENTMRAARAKMRGSKQEPAHLICDLLRLNDRTDLRTWVLSGDIKARAVRVTNRFFGHGYTNCSAVAVVAVAGFLERIHIGNSADDIARAFLTRRISMGRFLSRHLPGFSGKLTQVALFLHGCRYSRASLRQDVSFRDPTAILNAIIEEQQSLIAAKQALRRSMGERRGARLARRLERAQPFKEYHTFPNVFTEVQVATMNDSRPADDQLVRLSTGLLRDHCCYPDCPEYLKNFATAKDRATWHLPPHKVRRHGLMHHLCLDELLRNKAKSFHLSAQAHARLAFPAFRNAMAKAFKHEMETGPADMDWEAHFFHVHEQYAFMRR